MSKWITVILVFFLCACSNTVQKNFFQLPASQTLSDGQVKHKMVVYIAPVMVADILNYDGIVVQTDDVQYVVANNNQWLTPLDRQLRQTLIENLTALSANYQFTTQQQQAAYELDVQVLAFNSRYDGHAVIRGNWQLKNKQTQQSVRHEFNLSIPMKENGYPALVRTLAQGWQQVAEPIANRLAKMNTIKLNPEYGK